MQFLILVGTMVGLYMEDALPLNILESMGEYKNKYNEEGKRLTH